MCGIVGGINSKLWRDTDCYLKSLVHRGPDSHGAYINGKVFLGHTRLAIQDLSENANQPMFSEDGRYVIVFNGEIYNHSELRATISSKYNFRSSGDTETVLYAYIEYGAKCLDLLNGIFSLVIFDNTEKLFFIARDHFGVKPLYYYKDEHRFLFSSEIKSLLLADIRKEIDPRALVNYLTFLWSPAEKTPFLNVIKLLPGHYMKFFIEDYEESVPVKFYEPQFNGTYSKENESVLTDQLEQYLISAVRRQMLSDVPVGFFLSGGLDSTLLVAIAKKLYPSVRFPCFTIDIDGKGEKIDGFVNDINYAKKAASFLDVELHIVKGQSDILTNFDKMIWHLDEPQADPAPLHVINIANLAKQYGIKVLIGGAAGDDIFSGYRRHQALNYEKLFNFMPISLRKVIKFVLQKLPVNSFRRLKKLTEHLDLNTRSRMKGYFQWMNLQRVKSLFLSSIVAEIGNYDPMVYFDDLLLQIPKEKNLLNQMLFWEMKTFLVNHNLNYTDKMAMAVGVEVRVPFLDKELVEFSKKIPPKFKMKGNTTKYLLKKVAERYLPKEIIYRPKTGFGAPVRKWITSDMDEMIKERLSIDNINRRGIFNHEKVWELIEANKKGEVDASYSIWAILAIDSWITQFVEKKY